MPDPAPSNQLKKKSLSISFEADADSPSAEIAFNVATAITNDMFRLFCTGKFELSCGEGGLKILTLYSILGLAANFDDHWFREALDNAVAIRSAIHCTSQGNTLTIAFLAEPPSDDAKEMLRFTIELDHRGKAKSVSAKTLTEKLDLEMPSTV